MANQLNLSPEEIATYRDGALRRRQQDEEIVAERSRQAWRSAEAAATLLREEFNATRIVIFGSLARGAGFTRWSDVDIAAWGIAPEDTFKAMGAVMDMDTEVPVNLVDISCARPSLRETIEREGVPI